VWVGHANEASTSPALFEQGIRAVVQLAVEELPAQPPRELVFGRFPLVDGAGNELLVVRLAIRFVATLIEHDVATLVTCGAGMSRSPAIVAAAISVVRGEGLEECLRLVAEHHPVDVTPSFLADVVRALEHRTPR
jgi:protein-tyrosine phosphatase